MPYPPGMIPAILALGVVAAPLPDVLESELHRAMAAFAARPDPPYYARLAVEEVEATHVAATAGTLRHRFAERRRWLDTDVRVGTPELDSTHPLRGMSAWRRSGGSGVRIPLSDEPEHALRQARWRTLDRACRDEAEAIVVVRSNQTVKAAEEHPAPDFEQRAPVSDERPVPPLALDADAWQETLVAVSARLDADRRVEYGGAELSGSRSVKTLVDTEGTRIVHGRLSFRVSLDAGATASDGDRIHVHRHWDRHTADRLPDRAALEQAAGELLHHLAALLAAPRGQPYSGPVLLRGKAAAVFFHEVLGHRVEGHRQKLDEEGKTFTEYVGRRILPDWVDVWDDPTLARLGGEDLNGFYDYDDEGVAAARTTVVDDGVLRGFLMGRSPIQGFSTSNGHGRRSAGKDPTSRMANLVVEVRDGRPFRDLKAELVERVRDRGLPYGVIVDEIDGGFTYTGRDMANAFSVRASTTWRIYPDGRPDELVRGIDLVGTPLVAFGNLLAAGDDAEVFDGVCGAESGWVPVSAVAPSVLFETLEFQLQEKGEERPPLLGKPEVGR